MFLIFEVMQMEKDQLIEQLRHENDQLQKEIVHLKREVTYLKEQFAKAFNPKTPVKKSVNVPSLCYEKV